MGNNMKHQFFYYGDPFAGMRTREISRRDVAKTLRERRRYRMVTRLGPHRYRIKVERGVYYSLMALHA